MQKTPTTKTTTTEAPLAELTEAELDKVSGGFNGSGKTPSGNKIGQKSNNPNDGTGLVKHP